MKQRILWATAAALVGVAALACGSEEGQDEMPVLMKHRFETEMKAVLHDLKVAEEQASALEGRYLALEALRGRYFNRPVPDGYVLALLDVTPRGFRAEVTHERSGLRCHLVVSEPATEPLSGVPRCD